MVCHRPKPSYSWYRYDPCDGGFFFGIPVRVWVTFFMWLFFGGTMYIIYHYYRQRFITYMKHHVRFWIIFMILIEIFDTEDFFETVFCSCNSALILTVYLGWNYYVMTRVRGVTNPMFWSNLAFSGLGACIALYEFVFEKNFNPYYYWYLDVLALFVSFSLKEQYMIHGLTNEFACLIRQFSEGIFTAGLGKGAMTCFIQVLDALTDECQNVNTQHMIPDE